MGFDKLSDFSDLSLDAAGLVALADLVTVLKRTSLTGTATLLDCLVLCPGFHRQHEAPKLNAGEYPICAAMTTGYIFRIENQATVTFLQSVGRTGHLTNLTISSKPKGESLASWAVRQLFDYRGASLLAAVCYFACIALTTSEIVLLIHLEDWWSLLVMGVLILARLINVLILRRRAAEGWKGEPEPDAQSDLIVLMSQDRWIRVRGSTDDVKVVTSGEWLREPTFVESGLLAFATLIVYLDAALAGNGSVKGKLLLLVLLFGSAALLGLANEYTEVVKMYDRSIRVDGKRKAYQRRLHLAEQLIKETGNTGDWAVGLGMVSSSTVITDLDFEEDRTFDASARAQNNHRRTTKAKARKVIREL